MSATGTFDLCGALPEGVTVLEASAGTGKTYTIAALAARYVADGLPLERLLLITFTRIATGELRDRVRERLVTCEQELSRILAGAPDTGSDPVITLLARGEPETVTRRRDRLARAVANFDAATIATTHGFCQEVLAELGTIGDLDPDTVFVEDVSELLEEALDDLYVRRFGPPEARERGTARFARSEALRIARDAVFNPLAELAPRGEPRDTAADLRYRFAQAIRREVEQRKRRLAVMTYDDLLTRLNQILDGPNRAAARARLASRYDVVLVDEFQDTDPIQWQILHRAFATNGVTLVLIADPKQAIYAFRGADVYAYLLAATTAGTKATLRLNRRSDQPLLDAYDALFADARLGHPQIVYRQVRATPAHQRSRLIGAPSDAALRVRFVDRDDPAIEQTNYGYAKAPSARARVAGDLAADVVRLLDAGARLEDRAADGTVSGTRLLCPGHVAVLVRTHANANLVCDELRAAGVPAVINGAGSVFATRAAREWLRLLEALERPSATLPARTVAATAFLGWDARQIATASEADWEDVHRCLHEWARILRDSGVAALSQAVMTGEELAGRMLGVAGGERRMTDLSHLAQLLHRVAIADRLGVTALRGWLAERVAQTERDDAEEELMRRLESDAEAVQVLTIHRSKGLEFPVVYCPFLWEPSYIAREGEPVFFHDPAAGDVRTVDVGLEGRAWAAHRRQHVIEQRGEDLRLAYVALTRAKHQATIWWAGSFASRDSPLGRLLFSRADNGEVAPEGGSTPTDEAAWRRFEQLAADAPECIALERARPGPPAHWNPPPPEDVELRAARFDRRLDLGWRRTSYSDITAEAHEAVVASEPELAVLDDEPEAATPAWAPVDTSSPELSRPSPMQELPVGAEFGTFVHTVLQSTDFAAADLETELAAAVAAAGTRRSLELDPDRAVAGLRAAIETPLGPRVGGIRLRDITRADRLNELEFELPLAGGDDPTGRLTLRAIATVLRDHLPAEDPLAGYAARLEDPALRTTVRGFLTGSIDLVLRLDGPRYAVVDYKTNWLGPPGQPLTVGHYHPSALPVEMSRAHYGLQALLYTVALHRYLRWRLPGYAAERDLAGVLYLFLRGMAGAQTPTVDGAPCGVFAWRAPGRLVEGLSDVLDRGRAA